MGEGKTTLKQDVMLRKVGKVFAHFTPKPDKANDYKNVIGDMYIPKTELERLDSPVLTVTVSANEAYK